MARLPLSPVQMRARRHVTRRCCRDILFDAAMITRHVAAAAAARKCLCLQAVLQQAG